MCSARRDRAPPQPAVTAHSTIQASHQPTRSLCIVRIPGILPVGGLSTVGTACDRRMTAARGDQASARGLRRSTRRMQHAASSHSSSGVTSPPPPPPPEPPVTVTLTDFALLPPAPSHVRVKVVELVSAGLVLVPLVARVPLQPPEALHAVAFWLVQIRLTVAPEETELASLLSVTMGTGGAEATLSA